MATENIVNQEEFVGTHRLESAENGNRRWSNEEDNIIQKYYPSEGSRVATRLNGRTIASCQSRACKLGINRQQPHKNGKWQPDEDEILRTWYPKIGVRVAGMLPYRTKSAIQNRAALFGLHRGYSLAPVNTCQHGDFYRRKRKLHFIAE